MELICKNDKYSDEYLKIFLKYDIKYPKENDIVEMVGYEKLPRINKIGLFVKPFDKQYISGEIFGVKGDKEVSFNAERFTTLLGEPITEEMLKLTKNEEKVFIKQEKLDKNNPLNN